MLPRFLRSAVEEALGDRPVVLVHGPRQTGKTTLVRALTGERANMRYITLDDATALGSASADPDGFVAGMDGPTIIDEVQRVPELLRAIKRVVDEDRQPGRFVLTGSANVLALPRLSESLAGRMEVQRLWPLAQAEIESTSHTFVDAVFKPELPVLSLSQTSRAEMAQRIARGGFPEAVGLKTDRRRRAWYASYVTTILQRDVRDLSNLEKLAELPRLLTMLASRSGTLLSYSSLARDLAMAQSTLKRYFALLEATFLLFTLPAWATNVGTRLVKSPKVVLLDAGLCSHLLGLDAVALKDASDGGAHGIPEAFGSLLESFVISEIARLSGWSDTSPALLHFRTHAGREVDLVLENGRRSVVGVEVKSSAVVSPHDLAGLRTLAELAGPRFLRGIVVYLGRDIVPFASNLHAVPISALWRW